jgi:undecaprenyl-diphosphatase
MVAAAATTALSLFIKVAEEVVAGDTHQIDLLIIMWLRAAGNPLLFWVEHVFYNLSIQR